MVTHDSLVHKPVERRKQEQNHVEMDQMTLKEAAAYLGCPITAVYNMIQQGHLCAWRDGHCSYVQRADVVGIHEFRNRPKRINKQFALQSDGNPNARKRDDEAENEFEHPIDEEPLGGKYLIDIDEAVGLLRCSRAWVYKLAQRGKLTRYPGPNGAMYDVDEIERISQEWTARYTKFFKTTPGGYRVCDRMATPKPDEDLITIKDAAAYLGITITAATHLVGRGKLPAYQKAPGMPGSKLWVPAWAVAALGDNPDYNKWRAGYEKGAKCRAELRPAWEECNIGAFRAEGLSPADRDHGQYYSTRQAAVVLGIHRATLRKLRERGRLTGYRHVQRKQHLYGGGEQLSAGNRWWFFLKSDVHALMADMDYLQRHELAKRGLSPKAKQAKVDAAFQRWLRDAQSRGRSRGNITQADMRHDLNTIDG